MLSLVLAATVITAPATLEEGCDPQKLAPLVISSKADRIPAEMELDRRIAATLGEERKATAEATEAAEKQKSAEANAQKLEWGAWALGLAGLLALVMGAQRRSIALMGAAFALAVAMGLAGSAARSAPRAAQAASQAATARQLAVTQCRFRVSEARMQMMQSRIANTTHDMDEADEDIWGWVTRLENDKQPVTIEALKKLHGELRETLRY